MFKSEYNDKIRDWCNATEGFETLYSTVGQSKLGSSYTLLANSLAVANIEAQVSSPLGTISLAGSRNP